MRFNRGKAGRQRFNGWLAWLAISIGSLSLTTSAQANDWAFVGDSGVAPPGSDAVLLNDGRVLFNARLYDPATGLWSPTNNAGSAYLSTNTLLNDGRVLNVGHYDLFWYGALPYAQIFDPATNSWTSTTNSNYAHGGHLAVKMPDGRVLIAGGSRDGGVVAEIFDPATETWAVTGNMNEEHVLGFIELLDNGRVMVGGGSGDFGLTTSGIELYDPANGKWTSQSNPPAVGKYPAATKLLDGRVLVASDGKSFLYDATTDKWSHGGNLNVNHNGGFRLTTLSDGKVLIAGGFDFVAGAVGNAAEVYDPARNSWTRISDMPKNRYNYGATLLNTGHVLIASGENSSSNYGMESAILYTPPGTVAPPVVTPPPPPPAPEPIPVHIGDLDNISVPMSNGLQWVPEVNVTVLDNNGNPVSGVTVTGDWNNGVSGTASCATLADGTCTIYNLSYPYYSSVTSAVFTVTDASSSSTAYDAASNSDPDGDSDGTSIFVAAPQPPPPVPTPSTVSVADIDGVSIATSKNRWHASVTIMVSNDLGTPVANATITGDWSGGYSGTASCSTNSAGWCSVNTGDINIKATEPSFTVTNVSASGLAYDATANSDPDGDSDGTTITVLYSPY